MTIRTRTQNVTGGTGLRKHNVTGAVQNTYTWNVSKRYVRDDVRPGDNWPFNTYLLETTGGAINGATTGSLGKVYENMQPDDFRLFDSHTLRHIEDVARPSDALLVAKLLANTNPFRADVDIPTFIGELREIPELFVKEATLIKRMAGTNLKYQFGVKPLVSDVMKLLDFQTLVLKREQELEKFHDSKGLTRNHLLYKSKLTDSYNDIIHDRDKFLVRGLSNVVTERIIRGHVRWKPRYGPNKITAGDLRKQARKAALGLTVDFNTAYQLMPWSWLIDWCSNFGDILSLTRGAYEARFEHMSLIEVLKTTATFTTTSSPPLVGSGGTWRNLSYDRIPQLGFNFDFQLPHLSTRQTSILGSIGVTRRMPRSF